MLVFNDFARLQNKLPDGDGAGACDAKPLFDDARGVARLPKLDASKPNSSDLKEAVQEVSQTKTPIQHTDRDDVGAPALNEDDVEDADVSEVVGTFSHGASLEPDDGSVTLGDVDNALKYYLNITEKDREEIVQNIRDTKQLCFFTYDDAIGNPYFEIGGSDVGALNGWKVGAFCKDRHYAGRPDNQGIALGALPTGNSEDDLRGIVYKIRPYHEFDTKFEERVLDGIRTFIKNGIFNPAFHHKVVEVNTHMFGSVKAIVREVNKQSPLYLGKGEGASALSVAEKASIIATAHGKTQTCLSYWRSYAHQCDNTHGLKLDKDIARLLGAAELLRAKVEEDDPELFKLLTSIEEKMSFAFKRGRHTYNKAPHVVDVFGASENIKRVVDILGVAVKKVGMDKDPLGPSEIMRMDNLKTDLDQY